jgi:hypothetical protein
VKGLHDPRDVFLKAGLLTLLWLVAAIAWRAASPVQYPPASAGGERHDFYVTDWHGGFDGFMTTIDGHALNNTGRTIERAVIVYRIYDDQGAVVGTATGYLNTPLYPGQAWRFQAVGFCSPGSGGGGGKAGLSSLTYD